MGLYDDAIMALIQDEVDNNGATREDFERVLDRVFGSKPSGVVSMRDGVTFTPDVQSDNISYRIDHPDGRTEYLVLYPSQGEPDNGEDHATFLYHLDAERSKQWHADNDGPGTGGIADFASWASFTDHFPSGE